MKRAFAALSCAGLVGLAGLSSGCGYTELHEAVLRPTTAPTPHPVELYVAEQSPRRPYYEVALLEVFGYGSDADVEDLTAALQARARALGCDGILRVHYDMGRTVAHGYGVCVRWSPSAQGTVQTTPAVGLGTAPAPVPAPAPSPEGESVGQ